MKLIATKVFDSELVLERSITPALEKLGNHQNIMSLYYDGEGEGYIEWEIITLDDVVGIGLWFDDKTLTDYDGVFSLPIQAIQLLEENGFNADYAKD